MSANRVHYFIRSILQNSKLNREKFVKNKITYNSIKSKNKINSNYNMIIKRKMSTSNYSPPQYNSDFGGGGGPSGFGALFVCAAGFYFVTDRFYSGKK